VRFGLGVLNVIKEICFANEIIIFARYILMNEEDIMLAYTYIEHGKFELQEKARPEIKDSRDAVVRVTLGSICTSDLHIKHGSVPRAVPGITVGHEMVGVVEQVGADVTSVKPGDRVTVNVETFCGECFFCKHGYVNNCTDPNGGWAYVATSQGFLREKSYPFCSITWQTTSGTEFPAKIPAVLIFIPLPKEFKISCAIRLRHISLLLTISIFFIHKFYFYLFPDIATLITPSNLFSKIR
jgi:hypothetical protein